MSCYEWEGGKIKLPTKEFTDFRKKFIAGYNEIQQDKLESLKRWRNIALSDGKGRRMYSFFDRMVAFTSGWDEEEMVEMLFPKGHGDGVKPITPTKKMFDFVNGRTDTFNIGEAGIYFDRKTHTITWSVFENNHACEHAHSFPEAKLLFRLLSYVVFTTRTGGVIVGNDEYNRESDYAGGGGNYVKMTFGNGKEVH